MLKIQDVQAETGKIVYGKFVVDSVQIPLVVAGGAQGLTASRHRRKQGLV